MSKRERHKNNTARPSEFCEQFYENRKPKKVIKILSASNAKRYFFELYTYYIAAIMLMLTLSLRIY